ncbi:MAG: ribose-phosphate pyrophosphokinase [Clostridiales bacterium]|nr:MAG: ribose-phosphate pyrophosphokinase [Clostridiales bacterium]
MNLHGKDIKIFSAGASESMAQRICECLGLGLGKCEVGRFSDGETSVSLLESVRGSSCFIVQSTCAPVNDNLMQLLIMIDAMKRASAGCITAVVPYFGYARQDRKAKARDPISAKLVADLISTAGADRVVSMDLHASQIQGFFNIPVDHLLGAPILGRYMKERVGQDEGEYVVVSPDLGSVTRSRNFAARIGCPLAIIDKRRQRANESEVMNLIGEVRGKRVILVDDMIDTAGTLCNAAKAVMEHGAKSVTACASHGVLSGPALERLRESPIEEVILLDTIELPPEKRLPMIHQLSAAPVFAEVISRINEDKPVSPLFV